MSSNVLVCPKFSKEERVHFLGGMGTVRNYYPEPGAWVYLVEMDMGPEPEMGRVGYETTILLSEPELSSVS